MNPLGKTHKLRWSIVLPFLLLLLGCASVKQRRASVPQDSPPASIEQINLLAAPVALNFDQKSGPDGFMIKVYAGNRRRPKPVPILSGTLEITMYDGILKASATPEPRRTWKYSAEELLKQAQKTSIGTAYQLAPRWGDAKPLGNKISIVARYTSPEGVMISSAPSVISVLAK